MRGKNLSIIPIATLLFFFQSCVLTNSLKTINYAPNVRVEDSLTSSKTLKIDSVKDNRGYDNPKVIFYKKNAYGNQMSGAYMADKSLGQIVRQGLVYGLQKKGISLVDSGAYYTLTSSIESIGYETISHFAYGDVITTISVKFELINNQTSRVEWMEILNGKGKVRGVHFDQFITTSVDNLTQQLVSDASFTGLLHD